MDTLSVTNAYLYNIMIYCKTIRLEKRHLRKLEHSDGYTGIY